MPLSDKGLEVVLQGLHLGKVIPPDAVIARRATAERDLKLRGIATVKDEVLRFGKLRGNGPANAGRGSGDKRVGGAYYCFRASR